MQIEDTNRYVFIGIQFQMLSGMYKNESIVALLVEYNLSNHIGI